MASRDPTPSRAIARASASSAWPTATAPSASRPPAGGRVAARALSYKSVESILRHGLDAQPVPARPLRIHPRHDNLRGPGYYQ